MIVDFEVCVCVVLSCMCSCFEVCVLMLDVGVCICWFLSGLFSFWD